MIARVSTTDSVHLRAGLENIEVLEHTSPDVPWGEELVDHEFTVDDGALERPVTPLSDGA